MLNIMKPLFVVGAGGFGKEVMQWALDAGHLPIAFYDEDPKKQKNLFCGLPVYGTPVKGLRCIFAIGSGAFRQSVLRKIRGYDCPIVRLKHPNSILSPSSVIGDGSIICPGVVICPDVDIGSYSLLNLNVTVGHDTKVGPFFTAFPGANVSGGVTIGRNVTLGTNSCIRDGVCIGDNVTVGMGSVVVEDVKTGQTVVGNPAKPIRR